MPTWTREKWDGTRNTDCCSKLSIARWENEQDELAVVKVGCEVSQVNVVLIPLIRKTILAVS